MRFHLPTSQDGVKGAIIPFFFTPATLCGGPLSPTMPVVSASKGMADAICGVLVDFTRGGDLAALLLPDLKAERSPGAPYTTLVRAMPEVWIADYDLGFRVWDLVTPDDSLAFTCLSGRVTAQEKRPSCWNCRESLCCGTRMT